MTHTISRLFETYDDARAAVNLLEAAGVPHDDISVVSNNSDADKYPDAEEMRREHDASADASTGAGLGGIAGGVAGLLAGIGAVTIPGIGPVVGAGWLAATAAGAVGGAAVGGVAGGIVGALTESGVHPDDANVYAEGLRRGGSLVTARVDDADAAALEDKLARFRPVDIKERGVTYRTSGWKRFDPDAAPYVRGS